MASLKTALSIIPLSKWLSDESLTKKAYLNSLAAAMDYGARLIVGFSIVPLLVVGLGDYLFGAWQILGRLTGYISIASGRPTQALKWTIAYQQTSTEHEEKRLIVGRAVAVTLLFLPFLTMLGGLLAWFAPSILSAPMEMSSSLRVAAGLLVSNLVVMGLARVPEAVLRGENQGYRRMGLSAVLVFVGGGMTALALYMRTGIVGLAVANLANTLLTGALFLRVVRTYIPWFGIARPSFESIRRFFGLSRWFLVWRLVMQLMVASDLIMLGMLDSVEGVTTYSLMKYTPETLISLVAIMVGGITPGLGGIIGSGDLHKAVRVRNEIMSLTWLVATAMGTTIVIWNRTFVQIWVGEEYFVRSIANLLIMLMAIQLVLIRNDAFMIDLTLDLKRKVMIGALSATVSIVLAGILVAKFNMGIIGLCLGFIAGRSILSLAYPWLVGRFLKVSLFSQLKGTLRPVSMTLLIIALALGIGEFLTARTWIGLILSVAVTLVLAALVAFYAGLSSDQRRRILQRVRQVMPRVMVC